MTQAYSQKVLCSVRQQARSLACHASPCVSPGYASPLPGILPFLFFILYHKALPPAGCSLQPSSLASEMGSADGIDWMMGEVGYFFSLLNSNLSVVNFL